ncbi:class I SAM-dependent DNA methyltransferase [Mucilaginibacter sp. KACC 22063]|uniref:class I SAM-dependent DNA methyltransferase n=1 Tax=Mucilaginibacter sp. KACC 22063 TaxID=3025666 RepID=UPI0023666DDA|nr:DNA methyltransferase [Mucilaginibacter sp. KACC 22063]WDF54345.1 hypothetical protein PQ461_15480 [Mucilaginibacter sp. KACC 22063]
MNIVQIENNVAELVKTLDRNDFIYQFLLAYDTPKSIIKRLKEGALNLSATAGEVLWKKKLFFKVITGGDTHETIDELQSDVKVNSHAPRFLIVTDYVSFLAVDNKMGDTLDIAFDQLPQHFDFFLPLAGMEKAQLKLENPADVKAAEKMAKLYDEISRDNPAETAEAVHSLNVFLSRLLFCFFAEDTEIFPTNLFTNSIKSHTQADGSDLHIYLDRLFEILNTDYPERGELPEFLNAFPYVNGGLFRDSYPIPVFRYRSHAAIVECGELNWKDINPDIFGSMIQAVVSTEHRGSMGMHYTSVPNIMKVIEPLFLNELYKEFENGKHQPQKLTNLLYRLSRIKIFDPACGSGNFLIIAYKELRLLEIKIIQRLEFLQQATSGFEEKQLALIPKAQQSLAAMFQKQLFSNIQLNQFYGIELDDFAHEVATLSLWLAQHQMNMRFKEVLGQGNPTLPLRESGNITHGNATRLNWEEVCPKRDGDEIYILGNPPYLGFSLQNKMQKEDMELVFSNELDYKRLDYISCWFFKATKYIETISAKYSFVSTNSICQGEQVALLWPHIFDRSLEIEFAHQSFKWNNNARSNAAVFVVIVGVRNVSSRDKFIFSNGIAKKVRNINAYLIAERNTIVEKRGTPLSSLPEMIRGDMPIDGGNLILSEDEKIALVDAYPGAQKFLRKFIGAVEFMKNEYRWCLWINPELKDEAVSILPVKDRIKKVREMRLQSSNLSTQLLADTPYLFGQIRHIETTSIVVPSTTSERRNYIPIGYSDPETIISNLAYTIPSESPHVFAIISSRMHMVWVKTFAGRLKSDFRYSSGMCYNTFPFPAISKTQREDLSKFVYRVLEEREIYSERSLSELYDPQKMPAGLLAAHEQLDFAVERCYRSRPFESDEERLEYLFKLYEQMIAEEKLNGTIFQVKKEKSKTLKNA